MKKAKSKKLTNHSNKPGERRKLKPTSGSERRRVAKESPDSNLPTPPSYKVHYIAVGKIEVGSNRREINQEKLDDLKRSIAKIGLIPFPHQNDLTMYGKDVMDFTSSGLRLM
jgi:hypothetical protein